MIPQSMHYQKRWVDTLEPQIVDDRTGDEIAMDVIKKLGLKV